MNILIVDDEKEIADLLELYLKNDEYEIFKIYSSKDVLSFLDNQQIDLAILDVMMPDIDGFELCKKIREKYNFPIIFLTAKIDEIDKLNGFSYGADDYITKPFKSFDLLARVKSQLRRYKVYSQTNQKSEELIQIKDIEINAQTHEFYLDGQKINLTPIEFSIMLYLCSNVNKAVSNDELFKNVWNNNYYENDNNTIMVHIRHLREKMNDTIAPYKYIQTIWGVGYKIEK